MTKIEINPCQINGPGRGCQFCNESTTARSTDLAVVASSVTNILALGGGKNAMTAYLLRGDKQRSENGGSQTCFSSIIIFKLYVHLNSTMRLRNSSGSRDYITLRFIFVQLFLHQQGQFQVWVLHFQQ